MQYVATYNPSASFWKSFFQLFTAKRLVFMFVALLLTLSFLYIYFINATIRNVVAYNRLDQQNNALGSTVDTLESQYIAEKSAVSLTVAYAQGYQDANTPQFISAATMPSGAALSYQ